tara:strand:+ start:717 stop:1136 length:420 start_codon:yes stop_codon:yes gene_type:complete
MKRNTKLLGIKQFKHEDHFNTHVNALLKHLYPNAAINDNKIAFKEAPYMGISIVFYPSAIYAQLSEPFRALYPKFQKNGMYSFEKLVNTKLQWTGSSGKCYMYPWDRNMFDDSILGMEQKAVFFVMVMEVALKFFIDNE